MFDLSGKGALVTGASGGIGSAIARTLHANGTAVALSGTRVGRLEELAADLGERTHVVPADLSDADAIDALPATAAEALGSLDILINNAGLTRDNLAMRMKDDEWQAVLDVNLTAAFRLSRAVLRGMMKNRWGRIISVTSVVGTTGNPGQANYAASKAGLTGMTKALAREVSTQGVRVNAVAPGPINTPLVRALSDDWRAAKAADLPLGHFGEPEDVAETVAFLCSDAARIYVGQTLSPNSGDVML